MTDEKSGADSDQFRDTGVLQSGYGPLDALLADDAVSSIMIEGHNKVFFRREGKIEDAPWTFRDSNHLDDVIDRIFPKHVLDRNSPVLDITLQDHNRAQLIRPPVAPNGLIVSIRKSNRKPLTSQELIDNETLSADAIDFLEACVRSKVNVFVVGG